MQGKDAKRKLNQTEKEEGQKKTKCPKSDRIKKIQQAYIMQD
jgi:hypothetical protein